jgi:transcriptional regulator with PAS, ATPase and Fis domain
MKFENGWNNRILVVDDEENIHQDFEEMLKPGLIKASTDDLAIAFDSDVDEDFLPEFELLHARGGKEAYEKVQEAIEENNPIAVAYVDVRMAPGWDGVETTRKIRDIDKNIEIVIMTAYTDKPLSEIIHDMELLHKLLYIRKPFAREEIQQMTISLTEKWNVERELAKKNQQLALNKQTLEAVLDSTRDAIAMFDVKGDLLFANRWYGRMFGLADKALEEMSADELQRRIKQCFQEPDLFEEAETSFLANPDSVFEKAVEVKLPERKVLYQFMAPVHDAEQNIIGRITVYRDVSKELEIDQMKAEVLRLRAELEMEYSFDNIIGKSGKIRDVYALMQQAIQSNITVLLQGESGTGKELVAKSIHFNSSRKTGPFIAVNCAAIPETLIESELFGHERGAFTGATARRIGRFEQANGGTILLDEIGEMPPALQPRLLRVLEEREIQRVGGTSTIPTDVRVIASTNRDLGAAMEAGEFREDLFYRVSAFPIVIPPLRERREDISLLAEHFLNHAAEKAGKSIAVISTEALQLLMSYNWPGNVRELENVIERAVLLETSDVLQASSLPPEIHAVSTRVYMAASGDEEPTMIEIFPLEEVEKQALARALKATGNNIRQTAKALGINRATVYRKMEKYGLLENK